MHKYIIFNFIKGKRKIIEFPEDTKKELDTIFKANESFIFWIQKKKSDIPTSSFAYPFLIPGIKIQWPFPPLQKRGKNENKNEDASLKKPYLSSPPGSATRRRSGSRSRSWRCRRSAHRPRRPAPPGGKAALSGCTHRGGGASGPTHPPTNIQPHPHPLLFVELIYL